MHEQQNIEWKESWRDEYLKWICGFANAKGGKLYIGINNHGELKGISNYNILLEQLPNKFRDLLGVYAEVNLLNENNKYYIEIFVPRYDVPISYKGIYYVRSGSTLQELKGLALNEFILKRTGKTWDDIVEQRATINDIDLPTIKKFLKDAKDAKRIEVENDIGIKDLLIKLRLIEDGKIKRAALILFGKDPGKFFSNMSIKIGKFGNSDADLKYHEVLEGNLIQLKERIGVTLNSKFFIYPINFIGMQRIEKEEYPVAAIREMILNALVHRNYMGAPTQIRLYDNQFSIWNDGELPEGITGEDLRKLHRSMPRNPLIADICFKGGYIDAWGRGTIKIIEACKDAGLPEPFLNEEQGGFLSKIFNENISDTTGLHNKQDDASILLEKYGRNTEEIRKKYNLNERQVTGILCLIQKGTITNSGYKSLFDITDRTALRDLNDLIEKNLIEKHGMKKGVYYTLEMSDNVG